MSLCLWGIDGETGMSQGPHTPWGDPQTPRCEATRGEQPALLPDPGDQKPDVIFLDQCFQIRSQMSK